MVNQVLSNNLRLFLEDQAKKDKFSGVVCMAEKEQVIFSFECGFANKEKGIQNDNKTKFNLGSISKLFTAIAVAQLVEKGKLQFDDPVGRHLPDYPVQVVMDTITIHHLLTHTSGLGSFIDIKYRKKLLDTRSKLTSIKEVLKLFSDRPPGLPIGEYNYSSDGYEVLGAIIEAASGKNYYDFVEEFIFQPAQMSGAGNFYVNPYDLPGDFAVGYTLRDPLTDELKSGDKFANSDLIFFKGTAGGSAYSTPNDLLKFAKALKENTLVSAGMLETMLTPFINLGSSGRQTKYQGYGFQVWDINGLKRYSHPGRYPGVNARFDVYPELDIVVIVLSNYDPPAAYEVAEKVTSLLSAV